MDSPANVNICFALSHWAKQLADIVGEDHEDLQRALRECLLYEAQARALPPADPRDLPKSFDAWMVTWRDLMQKSMTSARQAVAIAAEAKGVELGELVPEGTISPESVLMAMCQKLV